MATKKRGSSKKTAASKTTTKGLSSAALKDLQSRLNKDTRLRNSFLKDPGAILRREGVELGAEKEQQLAKFTRDITAPQREFFGAEIQQERAALRVRITIIIRIGIAF